MSLNILRHVSRRIAVAPKFSMLSPAKFTSRMSTINTLKPLSFTQSKQPLLLAPPKQPLLLTPSKPISIDPVKPSYGDPTKPQKHKCDCDCGMGFMDWLIILWLILGLRKH